MVFAFNSEAFIRKFYVAGIGLPNTNVMGNF